MKNIGKSCAGKSHARFDEGGQARACSLLYLCRMEGRGFAAELAEQAVLFERVAPMPGALPAGLDRRYQLLGPKEVDLDFAGRRSAAMRTSISGLCAGDELHVDVDDGRWVFKTPKGQVVGRSAESYAIPAGIVISVKVASIGVRHREDVVATDWRERMSVDRWEVVLPEVVIGPA